MIATLRMIFRRWTPWEEALTRAVLAQVGPKTQEIIRTQLAAVNKIQRIVGWREIDLYVMKGGRVDRSGLPTLFDDREFVLAKTATKVHSQRINTSVCCVGGYLFSFESDKDVKPFAFRKDLVIEVLEIDRRFA